MREKFIEFLKTRNLNLIIEDLYHYYLDNGKFKLEYSDFKNIFNMYVLNSGNLNKYIENQMDLFMINRVYKENKIINYY